MSRLALYVALASLCGCAALNSGGSFYTHLDAASETRLNQMGNQEPALVSVGLTNTQVAFPPLKGGEILGRSGATVLLTMPKGSLGDLGSISGLRRAVVWGPASYRNKMTVPFRNHLLQRLDQGLGGTPSTMLGTFSHFETDSLKAEVAGTGAAPKSVHGQVATMEADADAVFRLLALNSLTRLDVPAQLLPLRRN